MRLATLSAIVLGLFWPPVQARAGSPQQPASSGTPAPARRLVGGKPDVFAVALVFDAKTGRGPCAVTAHDMATFQKQIDADRERQTAPRALDASVASCRQLPLKDGTGYQLIILNPRFRADYTVTTISQIDLGTGIVEPRGLATIAPLNLASLGTPIAHGGRLPSTLIIAPMTPAQILAQLLDPATMSLPLLTLDSQAHDLDDVYGNLKLEADAMQNTIKQTVGEAFCESDTPALTIAALFACVDERARYVAGMSNARPCTAGGQRWNAVEFDCVVNQIDRRIGDLSIVRSRLAEYNFSTVADRLDTEAAQLATKLGIFRQNVQVAAETMKDVQAILGRVLDDERRSVLRATQRALVKKRLKDAYGAMLDEKELNVLSEKAADELTRRAVTDRLGTIRDQLEKYATPLRFTELTLTTLRHEARTEVNTIAKRVDDLNAGFGRVFGAINEVYLTYRDPQPTHRPIDTSVGVGTNRVVFFKLSSNEKFRLYQMTGVTATPPAPAGSPGTLLSVGQNVTLNATPANLPQDLDRRFRLELHKVWTANVIAGVVFSSLRDASFGLGTVSRNGDNVLVPILANDQRPSPHYLVGFNYYVRPRDSFPGATSIADRWRPGALFGIGLETTKQFFVGANFEPTLGIDLALGLHYGQQTALQKGYVAGQTAVPDGAAAAPTRSIMGKGVFLMIGFDLDIFRRFMGTAAPQ